MNGTEELTSPYKIPVRSLSKQAKKSKRCDKAVGFFFCGCQVCHFQAKGNYDFIEKVNDKALEKKFEKRSYSWILEQLSTISSQDSVVLNMPETAVLRRGKPIFILSTSRERTLKSTTAADKLKPGEIIKSFTNIVRNRKREELQFTNLLHAAIASKIKETLSEYSKETSLIRYKINENIEDDPANEEGGFRIMTENEFTELLWERASSNIWRKILYIQTLLKCRGGLGVPDTFDYYAADDRPNIEDIVINRKRFREGFTHEIITLAESEDLYRRRRNKKELYQDLCTRLMYYIAYYSEVEIIRMKVEFVRDDNGKVWIVYIKNILVRKLNIPKMANEREVILNKTQDLSPVDKEMYLKYLEYSSTLPMSRRVQSIAHEMDSYITKMQENIGIHELIAPQEQNSDTDRAFQKLRPTSAVTLLEYIDNKNQKQQRPKKKYPNSRRQSLSITYKVNTSTLETPKKQWKYNPRLKLNISS